MKIDLVRLLRDRQVCHPTTITRAQLEGDRTLEISAVGHPWWKDESDPTAESVIDLRFDGVEDGILRIDDFNSDEVESLETFSAVRSSESIWASPKGEIIFCSSPLQDACKFIVIVEEFLAESAAIRRYDEFLNIIEGGISKFFDITSSESFRLSTAPLALSQRLCVELEKQGVRYSKVPCILRSRELVLVNLGRSQFFCKTATAVFDERYP